MRSGSTWLHHNLAHHPDLFLPEQKELHFFNLRLHRGLSSYQKEFVPGKDKIRGEITPGYGVMPEWRIRLAKKMMPEARIVLIVRNPIDRAWSHAILKLGREQARTPQDIPDRELRAHFESVDSLNKGGFSRMVETWTEIFAEEQVLVMFFDDIEQQPRWLLSDVFEHIGVTSDVNWDDLPYNTVIDRRVRGGSDVIGSSSGAIPDAHRDYLTNIYGGEIERLAEVVGGPAKRWVDAL